MHVLRPAGRGLFVVAAIAFSASMFATNAAAQTTTLRVGHLPSVDSPVHKGVARLGRSVGAGPRYG